MKHRSPLLAFLVSLVLTIQWSSLGLRSAAFAQADNGATPAAGDASPVDRLPPPNSLGTPNDIPAPPPAGPEFGPAPPTAQSYVACQPAAQFQGDQLMVPVSFLSSGLGASVGPQDNGSWRLLDFGRQADFAANSTDAVFGGVPVALPVAPHIIGGQLFGPWPSFSRFLGIAWSVKGTVPATGNQRGSTTFLLQYPGAYITGVTSTVAADKVHLEVALSNSTRVTAAELNNNVTFSFSGARSGQVPTVQPIDDSLVPRTVLTSGDWRAQLVIPLSTSAPVQWFTAGTPPRLIIEIQRPPSIPNPIQVAHGQWQNPAPAQNNYNGLSVTHLWRMTGHGPVNMWAIKMDPRNGWRLQIKPGGYAVYQRARPSQLGARSGAALAINGGFFDYHGTALGAVMINGEWIRLPWHDRTAVGFAADGTAYIGNLDTAATIQYGDGPKLTIRDLNGRPDYGSITVLTSRFGSFYSVRPGEIAIGVLGGQVTSKWWTGLVSLTSYNYVIVASGGAVPWAGACWPGETVHYVISPINWPPIYNALGGGPRLVANGHPYVTALQENFRPDVRVGTDPRTGFGVDCQGRYIILVADGRQPNYSTGLTLDEEADLMIGLGAVNALNLDGGGSTALAIRGQLVNRPSDGVERDVSNALLAMR